MLTLDLLGSPFVFPSYGWRAPRWTHAHRYHVLYDDHPHLLFECAMLDELEPDLECWAASMRGRPPPLDPLCEDGEPRAPDPKHFLKELEAVRSEVRGVLKKICRRLQASYDAYGVDEDFVSHLFKVVGKHLPNQPELVRRLLKERAPAERLALLREALDDSGASAATADDLAALERLVARHAEHTAASRRAPDEPDDTDEGSYARVDLYDRVHELVSRIHRFRPHPIERSVPRAPPCDPEHSAHDAFPLPVYALRLMARHVRDLAELDTFLAAQRMPSAQEYLPPADERFATMVKARGVLRDVLERTAKCCAAHEEARAQRRALSELRSLCVDVTSRCDLFATLGLDVLVVDDSRVHDIAAGVLGALLSSDHPLAAHATARISAAMAITSRDVPTDVEVDLRTLRPSDEEAALIWDAKTTVYGEIPDDVLY